MTRWEIADKALERETGARGLPRSSDRSTQRVFELPSRRDVSKCVITKETIEKHLKPTLVTSAEGVVDDDDADPIEESA
jgi:ATP-dependent Clp protease ATP-binding subunit ClpX